MNIIIPVQISQVLLRYGTAKKNWITFLSLESIFWKIVEYVKRVDHFELDDRLKGGASITVKWNTSWLALDSRASVIRCSFDSLTFRMVRIVGRNTNLFFSSIFIFVRIFRMFVTFFFFFFGKNHYLIYSYESWFFFFANYKWKISEETYKSLASSVERADSSIEWYENSIHWWNMQIRYVLSHMHTREKIFKSLTKQWIALQIMDSGFHSFLVPTIFIDLRYFYLPSLYN